MILFKEPATPLLVACCGPVTGCDFFAARRNRYGTFPLLP
jgi:hypothetical protein